MSPLKWLPLCLSISTLALPATGKAQLLASIPQSDKPPLELEIRHLETPMGGGDPLTVRDSTVSFDRPDVFALSGAADKDGSHLYLIRLAFTLHPPEGGKRLKEARLKVNLKDPRAEAVDVFPKRLEADGSVPTSLAIRSRQIQPRRDDRGHLPAEGQVPVVVGFQKGRREVSWLLQGLRGDPLRLGPRRVFFLVRLPPGSRSLEGTVEIQGIAETWMVDEWWSFPKPQVDRGVLQMDLLRSAQ